MMYVGRGNDRDAADGREDEMRLPMQYHGVAFDTDEDLRRAEELFRRGYVFEEDNTAEAETENAAAAPTPETTPTAPDRTDEKPNEEPAAQKSESAAPASAGVHSAAGIGGALSGILGKIGTEELLLGGLCVLLLMSGVDDELLIMLVVLLFC